MKNLRINTIIVSRGMEGLLTACLHSLHAAITADDQVTVVDNASSPPYQAAQLGHPVPDVIRFDTHHGFGEACNLGAKKRPAKFYLFLNNDVFLHPKALTHMTAAIEDERVGLCGARLVFPDGTLQHHGVVLSDDSRGPYHPDRGKPSDAVPRDGFTSQAVTGACMLVKHEVFQSLNGFDTSYGFGLEDVDFCLRARQAGWDIACAEQVDSLHFESLTEGRIEMNTSALERFHEVWAGKFTVDG